MRDEIAVSICGSSSCLVLFSLLSLISLDTIVSSRTPGLVHNHIGVHGLQLKDGKWERILGQS